MYRRQRRSRLRYRKARFDNRKKPEGWLAPSLQNKLDTHIRLVDKISTPVPISKVVVEVAAFDIQEIIYASNVKDKFFKFMTAPIFIERARENLGIRFRG